MLNRETAPSSSMIGMAFAVRVENPCSHCLSGAARREGASCVKARVGSFVTTELGKGPQAAALAAIYSWDW